MVEGFVKNIFNTSSSVLKIKQIMVPNRINAMSNLVSNLQGDGTGLGAKKVWF